MGRRPRVNQLYSLILAMAIRPAQAPATRPRTETSSHCIILLSVRRPEGRPERANAIRRERNRRTVLRAAIALGILETA
jgi:hypothetical protein